MRIQQRWIYLDTLAECDAHYRKEGFIVAQPGPDGGLDFSHRPRREKAVLFAITPKAARAALAVPDAIYADTTVANFVRAIKAGEPLPTHGIVQEPGGSWSSKMGDGPVIEVAHPELLSGPVYGEPIKVYVRAVRERSSLEESSPTRAAEIEWR